MRRDSISSRKALMNWRVCGERFVGRKSDMRALAEEAERKVACKAGEAGEVRERHCVIATRGTICSLDISPKGIVINEKSNECFDRGSWR